jgi:thiamine monophosphate kinase
MTSIDNVVALQELRAEIVRKLNTFNMSKIGKDITQKDEIKILSDLKKDKVLTITRADKGNTIVIMNTYDYDNQWQPLFMTLLLIKKKWSLILQINM